MKYNIELYDHDPARSARYLLGTKGRKPMMVLGLNPSTADEKTPDRTITKIKTFAENADFDSFIMLNLYPQRTPYPDKLDRVLNEQLHRENITRIVNALSLYDDPSILAAWGETITLRPFLSKCIKDIESELNHLPVKWLRIGAMTKSGHPRHPSRAPYDYGLMDFDIKNYLKKI